ncbi:MAG TPA: tetratricopeptide repeat protein [Phycisphaerae bacterium]|nr:tetratricopeptide repeat protein [Phycisphaerae bacterium]
MDEQRYAGQRLVQLAAPYLDRKDRVGLAAALEGEWSPECLALLLEDDNEAVVRAAAVSLGVVGSGKAGPSLIHLLGHENPDVVEAAEDALWSIWFRAKGSLPQAVLGKIAQAIRNGETENVVPMLTELIRTQPTYAEAFHQRSQAHYLRGEYEEGLRDARRAYELNPLHFGALANIAHCYAAIGHYAEALKSYRDALALYPHQPLIRKAIRELRERVARTQLTGELMLVEAE